jgi:hypothetical protein
MPAAHHQHIPIDRNVVPDGPRGHGSTMVLLLLLLLLIMTFHSMSDVVADDG